MMGPLIILSSILLIYNIVFEISERDYRKDEIDGVEIKPDHQQHHGHHGHHHEQHQRTKRVQLPKTPIQQRIFKWFEERA